MQDLVGDAFPGLPPDTIETDGKHVVWDLHFTDFNPHFWRGLFKHRHGQPLVAGDAVQPYSGVLPGSGAEKHPYIGHACDTQSFWLQYHGTHLYAGVTAVCENYISKSEDHKFDENKEAWQGTKKEWNDKFGPNSNTAGFETNGAGRGVYTSQKFELASKFAIPTLLDNKVLVKLVLLVAIPGDLADRGVGVNFHSGGASGYGKYAKIPKHRVCQSLADSATRPHSTTKPPDDDVSRIMSSLHRVSGEIGGSPKTEVFCTTIREAMEKNEFPKFSELEVISDRQAMGEKARDGSLGEEPWTLMNLDGCECVSSAVHVVGFFLGYAGHDGNQVQQSRKQAVFQGWDEKLMPAVVRPVVPGSEVKRPKSQLEKRARDAPVVEEA